MPRVRSPPSPPPLLPSPEHRNASEPEFEELVEYYRGFPRYRYNPQGAPSYNEELRQHYDYQLHKENSVYKYLRQHAFTPGDIAEFSRYAAEVLWGYSFDFDPLRIALKRQVDYFIVPTVVVIQTDYAIAKYFNRIPVRRWYGCH